MGRGWEVSWNRAADWLRLALCLSQMVVTDREREMAKLEAKMHQLQSSRERQALKTAELEKTVETLTYQRDARDSAAAEAASRLSDDVGNLRLALEETSRRELQVITVTITIIILTLQ